MAINWLNATQQQLSGMPNGGGMQALSNLPAGAKQPKFPRAREGWEKIKAGLFGSPEAIENVPTITPQQQGIMELLQQLGAFGLQNPTAGFEPIEQQARNQFQQNTIPGIAERFTSMGSGNALSSGTFASQLGQAGAGLEGDLASQKAQFGQQNIQQLLQMLQLGLNPQSENIFRPAQNGLAQNAIMALIKSLTPSFGG